MSNAFDPEAQAIIRAYWLQLIHVAVHTSGLPVHVVSAVSPGIKRTIMNRLEEARRIAAGEVANQAEPLILDLDLPQRERVR